jgi:DNA-binding MarR family transcriptional regulator
MVLKNNSSISEQNQGQAAQGADRGVAGLFRLNLRLSTETLTEAASALEALGLEAKEFFVLDGIEERPFPAELSRHLSIPKPTMSMYVKGLERKGLIGRAIDPGDLRRHRLALTPAGEDVLTKARMHLFERYGVRLARLSEREQVQFAKLLAKLLA